MLNQKNIILSSLLLNIACGSVVNHQSTTKDVATPGAIDSKNKLYWYENELLVTGECNANQIPIRNNCQANKKSMSFIHTIEQVKTGIHVDIQTTETSIANTTKALREKHPTILQIRNDITNLQAKLNNTKNQLIDFEKQKQNITAQITKITTDIADYDIQLTAVIAQLTTKPADQILMSLKTTLEAERTKLTQKSQVETQKLAETDSKIELETQNSLEIQKQIDTQNTLLAEKLQSIEVTSPELQALVLKSSMLNQELLSVPEVFELIRNQEIAFRANHLNNLHKNIMNRIDISTNANVRMAINGIVEVKVGETWGGICDDSFSQKNAEVICRMLGKNLVSFSGNRSSSIGYVMDDLVCNGSENNILLCKYNTTHDCSNSEYVAVTCQ